MVFQKNIKIHPLSDICTYCAGCSGITSVDEYFKCSICGILFCQNCKWHNNACLKCNNQLNIKGTHIKKVHIKNKCAYLCFM